MTQLEKYPAYKHSGEFWLGEVPQHWETKKLKHLFFEKKITGLCKIKKLKCCCKSGNSLGNIDVIC